MTVQIIKQDEKPEWAVIPYDVYLHLVEQVEMLEDIRDYDAIKGNLGNGAEELLPAEVIHAILDGGNAIRVWREYRCQTQQDLSRKVGISLPYLFQLESGRRKGSLAVISAVARVLEAPIETLLPLSP